MVNEVKDDAELKSEDTLKSVYEDVNEDTDLQDAEEKYVPRNSVVAAKEKLYDKTSLTVKQVDKFIIFCILLIVVIILVSILN